MSFLARIADQARTASPDVSVARPKGVMPNLPAAIDPIDPLFSVEPVARRPETSATEPEAPISTVSETPAERQFSRPQSARDVTSEPDSLVPERQTPDPSPDPIDRPESVDPIEVEQAEQLPHALSAEGGVEEVQSEEPIQDTEIEPPTPAGPKIDRPPVAGGDLPTTASFVPPDRQLAFGSFEQAQQMQDGDPAVPDPVAGTSTPTSPGPPPVALDPPTQQPTPKVEGVESGALPKPTIVPEPDEASDGPRVARPRVMEPAPLPQAALEQPKPPAEPEKPPQLTIDQIDVVVTDPAPHEPAIPARHRLAVVSASRRYLRRL